MKVLTIHTRINSCTLIFQKNGKAPQMTKQFISYFLLFLFSVKLYAATGETNNPSDATRSNPWAISYILESQGHYQKAIKILEPMLKKNESREFALLRVGWLHYLQGEYNDAFNNYQQALRINSESFDAKLGITLPLMAQHRWREAIHYLDEVTAESPWNYTANIRLLACWEALHKWNNVKHLSQKTAAHFPSEAIPFIYLARALYQQGNTHNAKRAYNQALMRTPSNTEALNALKTE
jgi:tetratricopeptide (TPR) repeat protein